MIAFAVTLFAEVMASVFNGKVAPTAPVRVTLPVPAMKRSVRVSAPSPLTVLLNEISAPFEVMFTPPVSWTGKGKLKELAPVTTMLFPSLMRFALVKERFVSAFTSPMAPLKTALPPDPARNVKAVAPLTVEEKVMLAPMAMVPPLVESKVGLPERLTGPVNVIVFPDVVMLPPTLTAVVPV